MPRPQRPTVAQSHRNAREKERNAMNGSTPPATPPANQPPADPPAPVQPPADPPAPPTPAKPDPMAEMRRQRDAEKRRADEAEAREAERERKEAEDAGEWEKLAKQNEDRAEKAERERDEIKAKAKIERLATGLGFKHPDLALLKIQSSDVDISDEEAVTTALKKLAEEIPELVGKTEDPEDDPAPPSGSPKDPPAPPKGKSGVTLDKLRKMSAAEVSDFKAKYPDEYKALLGQS